MTDGQRMNTHTPTHTPTKNAPIGSGLNFIYVIDFIGTVGWARTTDLLFHSLTIFSITNHQQPARVSKRSIVRRYF
jgi:hypothetical protein